MLEILYRDDDIVAVHKPPGLMVHRSELDRRETRFAVQLLRAQLGRHVFPAHRLDRGTSGVLLLAFDPRTAARLGQAFESRAVLKRYLAVVRGWPEPAGSIEHPLRRLEDGKDVGDADAPRQDARTDYRRLGLRRGADSLARPRHHARRARRALPPHRAAAPDPAPPQAHLAPGHRRRHVRQGPAQSGLRRSSRHWPAAARLRRAAAPAPRGRTAAPAARPARTGLCRPLRDAGMDDARS